MRRIHHQLGEGYFSFDPAAYAASVAAGGTPIGQSVTDPQFKPYVDALRNIAAQYTAKMGSASWKKYTGKIDTSADAVIYQNWLRDHLGFRQFVLEQNPGIYSALTTNSGVPTSILFDALGPDWQMVPGDLGSLSDAVAYSDSVMSHAHDAGIRHLAIAVAAAVGAAAVAGAFGGSAAATATATAAETGGEIAPITLPASAVYLPTSIAPTVLSESASLLTMPAFDVGSAAALADGLVSQINTPEMQAAISAGAVPNPPSSLLSNDFTKWGTSTGIKYLEQQLGRALTPQESASVEQQMAAEIRRLQAQIAANGQGSITPNSDLDSWVHSLMGSAAQRESLFKYLAIGGLIVAGAYFLAA